MKKIFFIFVLVSCLTAGFAETGYNNKAWNTEKGAVKTLGNVEPGEESLWIITEAEIKKMLGIETMVYYHYFGNKLNSVSYTIPEENLEKLKAKLPKEAQTTNTITMSTDACLLFVASGFGKTENFDLAFNTEMWTLALMYEQGNIEELEGLIDKNGTGTIVNYNYNNDTNVYVFENVIQDYYCVVYIYHEQDF